MTQHWSWTEEVPGQSNWEPDYTEYDDESEAVAMAVERVKESDHQVCVLAWPFKANDPNNKRFISPNDLL
jgi:hypothetical protein